MKKNLLFSICMLALAVLTLCGVTFAYFSSTGGSGNQTVTLDNYEFSVSSTAVQTLPNLTFKAPTVINFPAVSAPVFDSAAYDAMTQEEKAAYAEQYKAQMNVYKQRGDDALFDSFCFPLLISATNNSMATMRFSYEIKAAASSAVNIAPALKYFVFDKAATLSLTEGGNAGKYANAMHAACDDKSDGGESDILKINEARMSAGLQQNLTSLSKDVYYHNQTVKTLVVCWLDYTAVREILYNINGGANMGEIEDNNVGAYRQFSLNLTVSVTAENTPLEGEGA